MSSLLFPDMEEGAESKEELGQAPLRYSSPKLPPSQLAAIFPLALGSWSKNVKGAPFPCLQSEQTRSQRKCPQELPSIAPEALEPSGLK